MDSKHPHWSQKTRNIHMIGKKTNERTVNIHILFPRLSFSDSIRPFLYAVRKSRITVFRDVLSIEKGSTVVLQQQLNHKLAATMVANMEVTVSFHGNLRGPPQCHPPNK